MYFTVVLLSAVLSISADSNLSKQVPSSAVNFFNQLGGLLPQEGEVSSIPYSNSLFEFSHKSSPRVQNGGNILNRLLTDSSDTDTGTKSISSVVGQASRNFEEGEDSFRNGAPLKGILQEATNIFQNNANSLKYAGVSNPVAGFLDKATQNFEKTAKTNSNPLSGLLERVTGNFQNTAGGSIRNRASSNPIDGIFEQGTRTLQSGVSTFSNILQTGVDSLTRSLEGSSNTAKLGENLFNTLLGEGNKILRGLVPGSERPNPIGENTQYIPTRRNMIGKLPTPITPLTHGVEALTRGLQTGVISNVIGLGARTLTNGINAVTQTAGRTVEARMRGASNKLRNFMRRTLL